MSDNKDNFEGVEEIDAVVEEIDGEEEANIIELEDDQGNTVEFEQLHVFEYAERWYIALLPVEPIEGMDDGEVLIMRLEEGEQEDFFLPVETEEELEGAWNVFMEEYYDEDEDTEE